MGQRVSHQKQRNDYDVMTPDSHVMMIVCFVPKPLLSALLLTKKYPEEASCLIDIRQEIVACSSCTCK